MSLLLALAAAAALAASAGGGFFAASRRHARREREQKKREKGAAAAGRKAPAKSAFSALPLSVGDVVVVDREERWLAGALLAKEGDAVVAALLFAPEGATTKAVVVFAPPRREILWLAPSAADSPAEPPASIEIDGAPMTRRGRLPVALSAHGQGAPRVGEAGILAEYEGGADDVAVVLTSGGRAFAWRGRRVDEGAYDRLGDGGEG